MPMLPVLFQTKLHRKSHIFVEYIQDILQSNLPFNHLQPMDNLLCSLMFPQEIPAIFGRRALLELRLRAGLLLVPPPCRCGAQHPGGGWEPRDGNFCRELWCFFRAVYVKIHVHTKMVIMIDHDWMYLSMDPFATWSLQNDSPTWVSGGRGWMTCPL